MRKWIAGTLAVAVLAGTGYLGAQIYSSQRFESEAERQVAMWNSDAEWAVSRHAVERGWFHSSGRIEARFPASAPASETVTLDIPYGVDHGLLSTTLAGTAQAVEADETLFGDVLDSDGPVTWNGRFGTRDQRLELNVEIPAFTGRTLPYRLPGQSLPANVDFSGLHLALENGGSKAPGRWHYRGDSDGFSLASSQSESHWGGLIFEGDFEGSGQAFDQWMTLELSSIEMTYTGRPTTELSGLDYRLEANLDDEFALRFQASLDDARMNGQSLARGDIDVALSHVDGGALRRFMAAWRAHIEHIEQAARDTDADHDIDALTEIGEPMKRAFYAVLASSPRLTFEQLNAESQILQMDTRASGYLELDGSGLSTAPQPPFETGATLGRRLAGELTVHGVPPMLLMYAGLPQGQDPLELELADGVLSVNGQPMPLFPPVADPDSDVPE